MILKTQQLFPACILHYTDIDRYYVAAFHCDPTYSEKTAKPEPTTMRFSIGSVSPFPHKTLEGAQAEIADRSDLYISLEFVVKATTGFAQRHSTFIQYDQRLVF